MNVLFNMKFFSKYKQELIIIASILTIAKLLSVIATLYLPSSSLEYASKTSKSNYFLFNFPRAVNISQEAVVQKPKEDKKTASALTMDSFTLKAVYAESDGNGFILLVNKKTNKDALVSRGETYEGYLLNKVLSKKAVFEKGGKEYILELKEDKIKEVRTVTDQVAQDSFPDAVQQIDRVARDEVKKYRKNLNLIQKEIRLTPVNDDGKINGFQITYVKKDSIFEKLGVQKGDILKKANGVELTSAKDALNLYKQIDKIKVFKMTLIRNGVEKELEYEIY